ncbi:hypothetical protein [Curtobacterium herbarum]|uniref:WXG100 family type VII secretion target n=1 Tax=Curtobacterium herbarum TaxID=150122 RepID=A0ABP4K2T8_9MICO|nr:hypothetical protein [Curtobacterium herbarum]MBM7473761.1 hypothetical protein [Curtobacterium herbarum]MCS6544906.1 hypothetical protein [Curtobacterium herbarum]
MPARGGNWALLDQSSDPMVADVSVLQELVNYYSTMAQEITSEAAVLKSIGDGDDSQFKGSTADAVRKKSGEVAGSLTKLSGRYDAIRDALKGYLPELERGLAESAAALHDAENAEASGSRAASMPDPSQNRASDAPAITSDEQGQIDAKHRAVEGAKADADAATARLRRSVDALNGAGKAAAATIRAAWDDGLHDTLGDKIKAFFSKLLKILVKIFTYIGIALAALAILIPGVGMFTFMAAVAASVVLVANITLAGMGEGSWLDVITSAVGLVLVGAGGALTKAVSTMKTAGIAKSSAGFQKNATASLEKLGTARSAALERAFNPRYGAKGFPERLASLRAVQKEIADTQKALGNAKGLTSIGKFREKPNWWHPNKTLWAEDKVKIADVLKRRDWRAERLFSVDRHNEMAAMQKEMWSKYGVEIATTPAWHRWASGGRVVASWGNTIMYGQGLKPTGFGTDQQRLPGYNEAAKTLTHGF